MAKYFFSPVVGIDVSSESSVAAILAPNGDIYRKSLKIHHTLDGFNHLVKEIKKVEKEFNMKSGIFMESTGVYHLPLFHFLLNKQLEAHSINPLITNCSKNKDIRKVVNDKKDAMSIAKIGKFENIKTSVSFDITTFTLKSLCREYHNLVDSRSRYKKKLSADLNIIFPGYNKVFSDITGVTSLAILNKYPSPKSVLEASKDDIINVLRTASKRSLAWCNEIYNKLIKRASGAICIGLPSSRLPVKITSNLAIIDAFSRQINSLLEEIEDAVNNDMPKAFRKNLNLLRSIPGVSFITAITLLTEIGDINNFKNAKQLVAYFGVDPSVNESGKFKSDKNKMSKRGTPFGRRALFSVALTSVRTNKNGKANNQVLLDYYKNNLKGKKKKVALGAVMHKLVKYIFAVLRDQKEYTQRSPKLHAQMYLRNSSNSAA